MSKATQTIDCYPPDTKNTMISVLHYTLALDADVRAFEKLVLENEGCPFVLGGGEQENFQGLLEVVKMGGCSKIKGTYLRCQVTVTLTVEKNNPKTEVCVSWESDDE